jgi:hypothetical protein
MPSSPTRATYQEIIDRARIIGQEQMFLIAAGLLVGSTVSAAALASNSPRWPKRC